MTDTPEIPEPETEELFLTGLVRRYRGPLLDYVRRLLHGDADRAEDVVQETLLRASLRARQLSGQGRSPRPWLYQVARNVVIDQYRRERARPREVRDGDTLAGIAVADPADAVLTRHDVLAAMSALSPAHREVLLRQHYLGQTGSQIAADLGVPVSTVKSRSQHAAGTLRLALHQDRVVRDAA